MSQTLSSILDELFEHHSEREQLRQVLANQAVILANQEVIQSDLYSIKQFLGVTNPNPSETQQVIDDQTFLLKQINTDLQSVLPKEN